MSLFGEELELPDGVTIDRRFFSADEATSWFEAVRETTAWRQDHALMFGKEIALPRLTAWYGDEGASYVYSGIENRPLAWTVELAELRDLVSAAANAPFNSVLANLYRDGHDSMGWHADNEAELGHNPVIASLSLGDSRTFRLRHEASRETISIDLGAGSLLVMRGNVQHEWKHCVPKTKRAVGPRINLTFRWIVGR